MSDPYQADTVFALGGAWSCCGCRGGEVDAACCCVVGVPRGQNESVEYVREVNVLGEEVVGVPATPAVGEEQAALAARCLLAAKLLATVHG